MDDPWKAFKGAFLLLICCTGFINGEIRCYCNESKCVMSSYMCKSQLGMCYSLIKVKDGVKTIVSGCADDHRDEPEMSTCAGKGIEDNVAEVSVNSTSDVIDDINGVEVKETKIVETIQESLAVKTNTVDTSKSGLTCCTQDMCNYRDSNEITITIDTGDDGLSGFSRRTNDDSRPQKDLWFKAAVIAVPIAGGFILILLVLLAVRMLRTDSRQHKRLIQIRRERSLTKAQLYVTDHFIDKEKAANMQNDIANHNTSNTKNKSVHHSQNSKRDHSHSHRNSNSNCQSCRHHHHHHKQCHQPKMTTHRDGHTYEQIVSQHSDASASPCENTCRNTQSSPCSSVIVWGKAKQTDAADVV